MRTSCADPVKLQAAANEAPRGMSGDKPNAGRSNVGLSPEAHHGEGDRNATRMEKDAGTEAPASSDREETSGNLGQPVLRLVMGSRDLSIANRRQRGIAPSPAMLKSLVLIEGGRHAAIPERSAFATPSTATALSQLNAPRST